MKITKKKFNFNKSNFPDFVSKLEALTKISDIIKLKIDEDNILMYGLVGETSIYAFKNYLLKTSDYIDFDGDIDFTMDYIIDGAKQFVKKIKFFDIKKDIKCVFSYVGMTNDENTVTCRSLSMGDTRYKMTQIGTEPFKIRDLTKYNLTDLLDISNSTWTFKLSNDDFVDAKKLSSINSDFKSISFFTSDNKLKVGEIGKWELVLCDELIGRKDIIFPKKYLSAIQLDDEMDTLDFYIYDSFILLKQNDSNLMVSFEQSFDDED